MGTLYLVRHGQASFGAADYDLLSPLGMQQCRALGAWFADHGVAFDAVLCGTLKRHLQSLAAIGEGHGALPPALSWTGLDEYDSAAVVAAFEHPPLPAPDAPDAYRTHFRLLRQGLQHWMAGTSAPAGMPSWADFRAGVVAALDHVRSHCSGNVLLVSSGGPIAAAVSHVLGTAPAVTIELNLRIRNSALTEFAFTPKRHMLVSYNALPHLEHPERRQWATYS